MRYVVRTVWLLLVVVLITQGALQCFSPETLKRVYNRLFRGSAEGQRGVWPQSRLLVKPSLMHRFMGFMLMLVGIFALLVSLGLVR